MVNIASLFDFFLGGTLLGTVRVHPSAKKKDPTDRLFFASGALAFGVGVGSPRVGSLFPKMNGSA